MGKITKYLMPMIYIGIVIIMILSVTLVVSGIKNYIDTKPDYKYTLDGVFESDISSVVKTVDSIVVKPFLEDNISVDKYFYDYNSKDSKKQENSLILFENTYIQNSGVNYTSNEDFDIISILDGEIINIEDNEIYGKVLTIKYNDNLVCKYYNVGDILSNVGYKVSQGEIIGRSLPSKFDNTKYLLHFEVYFKNKAIDPETIYNLKVEDLDKMD